MSSIGPKFSYSVLVAAVVGAVFLVKAGDLNPPSGKTGPTMRTLDEIYGLVGQVESQTTPCGSGIPGSPRSFAKLTVSGVTGLEDTIKILAMSHGIAVPTDSLSGMPIGPAVHELLRMTKDVDASTPNYYGALVIGTVFPSAVLELHDSSQDTGSAYYRISLTNVRVISMATKVQIRCDGSYAHVDEMAWAYEGIQWSFIGNDSPTTATWPLDPSDDRR